MWLYFDIHCTSHYTHEVDQDLNKIKLLLTAGLFSIYIYIYIYNSVVTCRHNIINSSASAPQNVKKIAVKKVSYVYVSMFGLE